MKIRLIKRLFLSLATLLLVSAAFISCWVATEITIRRVIDQPLLPLTEKENLRIIRYTRGHILSRCPLWGLSSKAQTRLIRVALERAVGLGEPSLMWAIADECEKSAMFAAFPIMACEAIKNGEGNEYLIFVTLESQGRIDILERNTNVRELLTKGDSRMVSAIVLAMQERALARYRAACVSVLERPDVAIRTKTLLRKKLETIGINP